MVWCPCSLQRSCANVHALQLRWPIVQIKVEFGQGFIELDAWLADVSIDDGSKTEFCPLQDCKYCDTGQQTHSCLDLRA